MAPRGFARQRTAVTKVFPPLCVIAAGLAVLLIFSGCGSSRAASSRFSTGNSNTIKRDRDNDQDNNNDDGHVLNYGQPAIGDTRQAIASLVTNYYSASAHEKGQAACDLLVPVVAEALPEDYGHLPSLRGRKCGTVLTKLFAQHHHVLAGESTSLRFVAIRVGEGHALVVMSFANLPEVRQMTLRGTGTHWQILNVMDRILE